ncbi:MAG: isoprenylcysteine carboxylmethyltransferase family protein [Anaerolineae bacterium]|nr:isoprenylcysteine carboxylmethyltransferase family protein [Phycisphaerae bacterium]
MNLNLKIPPPVVTLLTGAATWLISRVTRDFTIAIPASRVLAGLLAALGVATAISGVVALRRAQTTINPMKPESTTSLADLGAYRFTRNPMYLGLLLVLTAWAVLLSNPFALLGPVAFVLYMNRFQIAPEEEALTTLFGEKYNEYKARVRRWV